MADSRVLLADLARWCSRALDLTTFSEGLFDRLSTALPYQGAFLATVDPATLLYTRAFRRDMPSEASPAFVAAEFGDDDVNQLRHLVHRPAPIGWLDQATRGDRMSARRYRLAMRPFGLGDELRCALVSADSCWGLLCLHRAGTDPAFSATEAALLGKVSPYVAQALRTSLLLEQITAAASSGPGVLILSPAGELETSTLAGSHLLEQLAELDAPRSAELPTVVAGVVEQLRRESDGRPEVARARALTRQGQWLTVHASRLDDHAGSIAVIVEPTQPAELAPLLIAAYCLTPREAEVARALMLGSSRRLIASTLHLSPFTVSDHVKAVFAKTDVSSAGQLRMKIFRG